MNISKFSCPVTTKYLNWILFRDCPKFLILHGFNFAVKDSPYYLAWVKCRGLRDRRGNVYLEMFRSCSFDDILNDTLCEKCPHSEFFCSVFSRIRTEYRYRRYRVRDTPYFSVFSPNEEKYGPEKLRMWTHLWRSDKEILRAVFVRNCKPRST